MTIRERPHCRATLRGRAPGELSRSSRAGSHCSRELLDPAAQAASMTLEYEVTVAAASSSRMARRVAAAALHLGLSTIRRHRTAIADDQASAQRREQGHIEMEGAV
jgi:hypothetical protein